MHRSRIGVLNDDGTLETVYLGANGYLQDAGRQILEWWNSEERARLLIQDGGLMYVGYFNTFDEANQYQSHLEDVCADLGLKYVGMCSPYVKSKHQNRLDRFKVEKWN